MVSRCLIWIVCLGILRAAPAVPWSQEIYVWQRQASPALATALTTARPLVDGFHVLAAEVSWVDGQQKVFRPALDWAQFAALGRPIGLVLRVGAYPGPFASDDAAAQNLAKLAATLLSEARRGGLMPAELQIDFDCAEAKLAGYALWLGGLRSITGSTPLVFTALPVWLAHQEFVALTRAATGFVLQVHSLEKPAGPDSPFVLCDPAKVRLWAEQAGRVGVPFRLALPTYGYTLAFDAAGKFFALAAEGPRPVWPAGTQVRVVRTDTGTMAQLARSLAIQPPLNCTGVIWFRLPIASDRLNWDWTTLAAVLRGEIPRVQLVATVDWTEPGMAEISIDNHGQTTESPPPIIQLRWPEPAHLIAADGLGGFRLETRGGSEHATLVAAHLPPDVLLAPGQRLKIAWLRFPHEIPLDATLSSAPP